MQVANIECQIAQAQLRRYLTGEDMPNAVVNELETHLRNCPDCMSAAQTTRESLRGVLSSKITGKPIAVVKEPIRREPKQEARIAEAVESGHAAVQTPADVFDAPDDQFKHTAPKKNSNVKTLAYSIGLALILVLMSTVFRDPTALFGPRASSITPDTPQVATNNETTPTEQPTENAATDVTEPPVTEPVTTPPTNEKPIPDPNTATKPFATDGLIVADGVSGETTVEKIPPKSEPKPQPKVQPKRTNKKPASKPGVGTVKVYPPEN